jgi:hypothetical protein
MFVRTLPLVLALLASGCATAKSVATANQQITVTVVNDLAPPREVTVSVTSRRLNRLLGDVPPQQSRTFTFKGPVPDDYQLSAKSSLSRALTSQTFNVTSTVSQAVWTLQLNNVVQQESP